MEGFCKIELGKPLSVQGLMNCSMEVRKVRVLRKGQRMEAWLVKFQRICGSGQLWLKNLL